MAELVPPAVVDGKFQLEDKSSNTGAANSTTKRPAPKAGGCRIEGCVKVKKVSFLVRFFHQLASMYQDWMNVCFLVVQPSSFDCRL